MSDSMGILDLKREFVSILETPSTTVSIDAPILHPPCYEEIAGLDLKRVKTNHLNGYDILEEIVRQKIFNTLTSHKVTHIRGENHGYLYLMDELFEKYPNLVISRQAYREGKDWVDNTDWRGYWEWKCGNINFFKNESINRLVWHNKDNHYFDEAFVGQFDYKLDLGHVLGNIRKEQVVDYRGSPSHEDILFELSDVGKWKANEEDKIIFADSILAARARGDKRMIAISFDKSLPYMAEHLQWGSVALDIEAVVHRGYAKIIDSASSGYLVLKFPIAYKDGKIHEAA